MEFDNVNLSSAPLSTAKTFLWIPFTTASFGLLTSRFLEFTLSLSFALLAFLCRLTIRFTPEMYTFNQLITMRQFVNEESLCMNALTLGAPLVFAR